MPVRDVEMDDDQEANNSLLPNTDADELGQDVTQIGVTVEPSVHWSTIIMCAQASDPNIWDTEDDEGSKGKRRSQFARWISVVKALLVLFASFSFQFILVRMIHKVIDNDYADLTEFCTASPGSVCETEKTKDLLKVLAKDTGHQTFFNVGEWFGIIAVMIYAGAIAQEIVSTVNYAGLLLLPDDPEELEGQVDENGVVIDPNNSFVQGFVVKGDTGKLRYLNTWIKCIVAATALGRIVLACLLLRTGVEFLALTDNLKDFILNSLALTFILEVDTVAFNILVPLNQRNKTLCMDEPNFTRTEPGQQKNCVRELVFAFSKKFVLYSDYLVFLTIIGGTTWAYRHYLKGFHHDARDAMCVAGCSPEGEEGGFGAFCKHVRGVVHNQTAAQAMEMIGWKNWKTGCCLGVQSGVPAVCPPP